MATVKKTKQAASWIAEITGADIEALKYNAQDLDAALAAAGFDKGHGARIENESIVSIIIPIASDKTDVSALADALKNYSPAKSEFELEQDRNDAEFSEQLARSLIIALNSNRTFRHALQRALGIAEN